MEFTEVRSANHKQGEWQISDRPSSLLHDNVILACDSGGMLQNLQRLCRTPLQCVSARNLYTPSTRTAKEQQKIIIVAAHRIVVPVEHQRDRLPCGELERIAVTCREIMAQIIVGIREGRQIVFEPMVSSRIHPQHTGRRRAVGDAAQGTGPIVKSGAEPCDGMHDHLHPGRNHVIDCLCQFKAGADLREIKISAWCHVVDDLRHLCAVVDTSDSGGGVIHRNQIERQITGRLCTGERTETQIYYTDADACASMTQRMHAARSRQ